MNAWDLHEDNDSLDLFISIFNSETPDRKVPRGEVEDAFHRCRRFLERSLNGLWSEIEESSPGFEPSQSIHAHVSQLKRARVYLLTNGLVSPEVTADEKVKGVEVSHHVWDLERFFQVAGKDGTREPIDIDRKSLDGGIPCVQLPDQNGVYDAYIGVIPGKILADLYGKWGQRLLERNVRSYLQNRGVNKGIQETIAEVPWMFLAYNNGISTTADAAEIEEGKDGKCRIIRIKNLQIVNGGQTTASLYEALKRHDRPLDSIQVQIKLTVLKDHSTVDHHVSLISRYANSQTKVNVSDFSANHPFHITLEKVSRATWAPNPDSRGKSTTKWYYERARGQYINELNAEETPAKRRAFKLQYPKNQRLTKQLIAKYEMSWHQLPHVVSLGREKNFIRFMDDFAQSVTPDETYFCALVAKAILFRDCDAIVKKLELGSHKANVVTYSIAWLSYLTRQRVDLNAIWERQGIDEQLQASLSALTIEVRNHITNPTDSKINYGEWAKKESCWNELKKRPPPLAPGMVAGISTATSTSAHEASSGETDAGSAVKIEQVMAVPAETWFGLARWAKETDRLTGWDRSFAFNMGRLVARKRPPSPKQAHQALRVLQEALDAGFNPTTMVRSKGGGSP